MSIHLDRIGVTSEPETVTWSDRDAMLYALSVGAGGGRELTYTTENSQGVDLRTLPTFATVLGTGRAFSLSDLGDFSLRQVLHGGQSVIVHQPLQPSGQAVATTAMTAVRDKGRNAVVETTTWLRDRPDGEVLVELTSELVVLGEGGFRGDPGPAQPWVAPDRAPDGVDRLPTSVDQALLYRLNGDRNPLHSDPAAARAVGFDRPILHGLCTFGFGARALLARIADHDVERFVSVRARFAAPVLPGDVLEVRSWRVTEDEAHLFQCWVDDRLVLDRGVAVVAPAHPDPAHP